MERSLEDIREHADELADRCRNFDPTDAQVVYAVQMAEVVRAARGFADGGRTLATAVEAARDAGAPWSEIGGLLGASGEAARLRYGRRGGPPSLDTTVAGD